MIYVLFVDVRDTTLGVMAAAWFNYLASGWGVADSAGITPAEEPDLMAVQVMGEEGVSLLPCAPQALSGELLAEADFVVSMNPAAAASSRPAKRWDFDEPSERSIERYRTLRTALFRSVTELIYDLLLSGAARPETGAFVGNVPAFPDHR